MGEEFVQISKAVAIGFAVMGFIGYFVKLIHIPMYVPYIMAILISAHVVPQQQHSCVRAIISHPLSLLTCPTEEAHDGCPSRLLDIACVLVYIRGLFITPSLCPYPTGLLALHPNSGETKADSSS